MKVFNPSDRELIEAVKKAACEYYEISETDLIESGAYEIANLRYLCFWLIMENTKLKDYVIADIFNKKRSTVIYGVGLIEIHKEIYRQTLDKLKAIAELANNFEKKYSWHIHLTNTSN